MNIDHIIIIFKKELLSLKRDKKALITIFLPILIYPILMFMFFSISNLSANKMYNEKSIIGITNDLPKVVNEKFNSEESIKIIKLNKTNKNLINKDDLHLILTYELKEQQKYFKINYKSTIDKSSIAYEKINEILNEYNEELIENNINEIDISQPLLNLVSIDSKEALAKNSSSRIMVSILGTIVPFILILYSIVGIFSISSDLTAGGKERGTLETILSIPIKKINIIIGKLFASVSVGILTAITNSIAMFPLLFLIGNSLEDVTLKINVFSIIFMILTLMPIIILSASILISTGMYAKGYQEAQTYGSFIMIFLSLPCYIGMIPTIEYNLYTALIPVTNGMLAIKEAFYGNYSLKLILTTYLINLSIASLTIFLMSKIFSSEKIIFGISSPNKKIKEKGDF